MLTLTALPLIAVFTLLSTFHTFYLGFIHPLQDVALHQCLPLSSVCCFPVPGGSLLPCYAVLPTSAWSSDPFPVLGCHSVQRLVHPLSFILAVCPAHLHFCFSVYSMSIIFVLFLIWDFGLLTGGKFWHGRELRRRFSQYFVQAWSAALALRSAALTLVVRCPPRQRQTWFDPHWA